jgi:hypothetical protein
LINNTLQAVGLFDGLISSVGYIAIILLLLVVGFGSVIFIVWLRRKFDFEGQGEPIGRVHIEIMGKYALEGNLAEWQMIDPEQLDLLKQHDELKVVPDVLKQMYNEKQLFIYTLKNPDDSDIMDKLGNRTFIISSGNLKSEKYFWYSQKGKFTFRSIFTKEKTRNVVVYSSARKVQVLNEDRNLDDWWVMSPLPIVNEKQVVGFDSKVVGGMSHHIEVKEITNGKALSSALNFIPFVTDALSKNDYLKKELEETKNHLDDRTKQLLQANQKLQKKKRQLGQKPYVVRGKNEQSIKEKQSIMMMVVAVVLGSMTVMFVPDFLKNMPEQSAQFVGMVVALIAVGGIAYMQNKSKPPEEVEVDEN